MVRKHSGLSGLGPRKCLEKKYPMVLGPRPPRGNSFQEKDSHSPDRPEVAQTDFEQSSEYVSAVKVGGQRIGGRYLESDGSDNICSQMPKILDEVQVPAGSISQSGGLTVRIETSWNVGSRDCNWATLYARVTILPCIPDTLVSSGRRSGGFVHQQCSSHADCKYADSDRAFGEYSGTWDPAADPAGDCNGCRHCGCTACGSQNVCYGSKVRGQH